MSDIDIKKLADSLTELHARTSVLETFVLAMAQSKVINERTLQSFEAKSKEHLSNMDNSREFVFAYENTAERIADFARKNLAS